MGSACPECEAETFQCSACGALVDLAEQIAALVEQTQGEARREALLGAARDMGKHSRDDRSASHWRAFAWSNWLRSRAGGAA